MARAAGRKQKLVAVRLDEESIGRGAPDQEHEREVAIFDLVEQNYFVVPGRAGPYELRLSVRDKKLVLDVRTPKGAPIIAHVLSLDRKSTRLNSSH